MARDIIAKSFRPIGNSTGYVTRRAVSYTPANDIILRQWKFVGQRITNMLIGFPTVGSLNDVETIEWEIRKGSGAPDHKPVGGAPNLLAHGEFDFRFSSPWKLYRVIEYTINLSEGLELTGGEEYFFILKMPGDEANAYRPLAWADTYNVGDASEVDSSIYCCEYDTNSNTWSSGDNTYNLQYTVLDNQAGETWHVVIDGKGYMQPDNMRGFQSRQVASGLAQSRGGQSEYSQLRYPFTSLSQHDWFSGMGQLDVEDLHAYLYGLGLDTTVREQMTIGPKVHQTGVESPYNDSYIPTKYTARYLLDPEHSNNSTVVNYYAQRFTASGNYKAKYIGIIIGQLAFRFQHKLQVALFSASEGNPNTNLTGWIDCDNTWVTSWQNRYITVGIDLVSGTDYFIVVKTNQTWGRLPEHRVIFDSDGSAPGGVAKYSADGTTWDNLSVSMPFKINMWCDGLHGNIAALDYGDVNGVSKLRCGAGRIVYAFNESTGFWEYYLNLEPGKNETTVDITDIIHFNDRLFVAQGYDNPIRVYDGNKWGPATDTNIIAGGEFENAEDIAKWTDNDNATLSSEAGTGHTGNAGKLINDTGVGPTITSQAFTVIENDWYELYVWHKNGGGVETRGKVQVGNAVGDASFYDSGWLDNADWTELHAIFQITSGTNMVIQLICGNANGDYTLFDDVEFYLAPVAKYFHIGRGYLWKSDDKNHISHSSLGMSWSNGIPCGTDLYEITNMINYSGRVLVGKENGMWDIDNNDIAIEYYLFQGQEHNENCKGWAVFSGMLFIPMQDFKVWRWTGTNYSQVGPSDTKSGPTAKWPNKINRFAPTARYLFAAVEPQVVGGYGGLAAYSGIGWIPLVRHLESNKVANAICVTNNVGSEPRVWFAEGNRVDYIRLSDFTHNRYDDPDMDFDISGAMFVSSWWDGGLKDANKCWNRLTLIADIPDNTQIDIYFTTNGEDWETINDFILLGHIRPEDLNNNGEISLMFPDGLIAKSIQVIFHLMTWDEDVTPRIRAYNLECLIRQIPVDVYSFRIYLADSLTKMDGTTATRSANDMWEELRRIRAKDAPVTVSFVNKSFRGVISNLTEETSRYGPEGTQEQRWDRVAYVTVIEAQ